MAISCSIALAQSVDTASLQEDVTENFMGYLGVLIAEQVLPTEYLQTLINEIEQNTALSNPFDLIHVKSEQQIHQSAFAKYAAYPELNKNKIKAWAQAQLAGYQKISINRSDVRNKTKVPITLMKFNLLRPKAFLHSFGAEERRITMWFHTRRKIEVMETPVTQQMWINVMKQNPSYFTEGAEQIFDYLPNHPVENITWWSAAEFANRLSLKKGLPVAYDFSQIREWVGTPEEGTYRPVNLESAKKLIRLNARNNNIYLTKGYRLPTYIELMLLTNNRNRNDSLYFSADIDEANLHLYAWYDKNSKTNSHPQGSTQPVDRLKPYIIDGEEFFDVHGNVGVWSHDWASEDDFPPHGKDSQVNFSEAKAQAITTRGSWKSPAHALQSFSIQSLSPNERYNTVGFRLVRSLP